MRPERIDVSGLKCPMTWVRTKLALERLSDGATLEVVLGAGEMLANVPRNARDDGHEVQAPEPLGDGRHLVRVLKRGAA